MMNTSKLPLLAIYFVVLLVSTTYAQPYIFDSVCRPNDDVIVVDNDRDPEVIAAAYANIFQSQVSTCTTYSMSHYNDYDGNSGFTYSNHWHLTGQTPHDWGWHALFWKGFQWWDQCAAAPNTPTEPGYCAITSQNAVPLDPPPYDTYYVKCADKDRLNSIEANPSGPFTGGITNWPQTWGTSHNPNGIWLCVQESSSHVAAIIAAMSMYHWTTPTYLNLDWAQYDNQCAWDYRTGVIEKVTLCTNTSDPPHVECGWDNNPWSESSAAACSASLTLDSITTSFFGSCFNGPLTSDHHEFNEHVTFNAVGFDQVYDSVLNSGIGALILDPPATDEGNPNVELRDKLQKAARATAKDITVLKGKKLVKAKRKFITEIKSECYADKTYESIYFSPKNEEVTPKSKGEEV